MSDRTAMRLDDEAEADLKFLAAIYGTQTAAVKSALAELAKKERLLAQMRAFVTATEAESGPLSNDERNKAREYFR